MPDKPKRRGPTQFAPDIRVPFTYTVVHGRDSSKKSSRQKAQTKSMNLMGLAFETPAIEVDEMHLSFTEGSFGRNTLEIVLDLGKKIGEVEVLGQVEWYESRSTPAGHYFIIGVGFMDVQADVVAAMREYLLQAQGFL